MDLVILNVENQHSSWPQKIIFLYLTTGKLTKRKQFRNILLKEYYKISKIKFVMQVVLGLASVGRKDIVDIA